MSDTNGDGQMEILKVTIGKDGRPHLSFCQDEALVRFAVHKISGAINRHFAQIEMVQQLQAAAQGVTPATPEDLLRMSRKDGRA